jgi:hypothetical protein
MHTIAEFRQREVPVMIEALEEEKRERAGHVGFTPIVSPTGLGLRLDTSF